MTPEYIFGHAAGIAAVMIYVIVKSILWYKVPPVVRREGDRIYNVRTQHPVHRTIHRVTLAISGILVAVAGLLTNINVLGAYLLVLVGIGVLILFQESGRLRESFREIGFDDLEEALDALIAQEAKDAQGQEVHDGTAHDATPGVSQDYRDHTVEPSDGSEYQHGGKHYDHDGAEYQQDEHSDDTENSESTK